MDTGYGHMAHEHAVSRLREIAREREARLRGLRTRAQAERYVLDVRDSVARAFGSCPRRTPLRPRLGDPTETRRHTLQPLLYDSRPGFTVSGCLYLPLGFSPPYPAVLGLCGHSPLGKAYDTYQAFCQGLAAKGFLVLAIDPISQGERPQFRDADVRGKGALPELCEGHNIIGNQLALLGGFLGSWRVWDAIRAVDYLVSRADVDPARIGVTGNSGGGTLSAYLTALDPRLAMAAPGCFICSYGANLTNENPSDAEQNPPGLLASGLDQVDLLLCYAPRPTMILSQRDDFFDARASRRAFEEMRRLYERLGSRGDAAWFQGPGKHGFSRENREAMYGFMMRHAGVRGSPAEPQLEPVAGERLEAAGGMVPGARLFDFISAEADRLERSRRRPPDLARRARLVLGLPARRPLPSYRCLVGSRRIDPELRQQSRFAVESEPGVQVIVTTYGPEQDLMHPPHGPLAVYVGHGSGERDLRETREARALTRGSLPLAVVEPRGFGPTRALTCGSRRMLEPYGADFLLASTADMLGESYLGRRVYDLLCALDFLLLEGGTELLLVGRGLGSVIVAFAALLHPCHARIRLLDYLRSFASLCHDPLANWPLSSLPRGVLRSFDLPDVYRALGRRLELGRPSGSRLDPERMP